jgi:hypothetical protein
VGTELVEKGLAKAICTKAWHLGKVNLSVSLATHLELSDIKGLGEFSDEEAICLLWSRTRRR